MTILPVNCDERYPGYEKQLIPVTLQNMHSSLDIRVIRFREKMEYVACVRQMRRGYIAVVESPTEETTWKI
jgi:hypothetical protein